ncbi:uncharacterized protein MONOS_17880 [Monocercomonoides exilis]|uniref:uncharacterized protein n=1 Tax=Monocercomonoides exilis TaxID=2049356 RepID=UPI003559893E|nr:hypothetical protein MONOS_17880 [Monocercomonoides exilis]
MNKAIDRMDEEELKFVFTKDLFDKIHQMIEKKKMTMENVLLLLKHVGYCKVLKGVWNLRFKESSLRKRFEKMIIDEEKKKGEMNKMLLSDFCFEERGKRESSKRSGNCFAYVEQHQIYELFLDEIKEITLYHQECSNMTQLAYQSAWMFLLNRLRYDNSLEEVIVNELHFGREAAREMEELVKCVDWKKKKEEERKDTKEELIILRWIRTLELYLLHCKLWNEGNAGLINSVANVFRAARDNFRNICSQSISVFEAVAGNRDMRIDGLLKGRAIDSVFEEIQRPTLNDEIAYDGLLFLMNVSKKLKEEEDCKMEEAKRKATKRNTFEKLEEEGYEDIITSFCEILDFLKGKYNRQLSLDISDYFVNV